MVVLRILEAGLYLFFSVITHYFEVYFVSFLEILGCALVVDILKHLIGIYFKSIARVPERTVIPDQDDVKLERIAIPLVHFMMVFKMCEGLGLPAQLAAASNRTIWVAKRKPRPIPKVHSKTILMFCEALNLDAELAHSPGRRYL
ncbi:hypothetical protein TNIN_71661 [Trichonephila inaurata madagascariensis]|uniref:Uncharacterized protein n=1 Tax=Trichonephila inaurata madagascariensis TaxID=2747483 RepID=A0A8X6YQ80_9ARAC|nr:hypothetical protein TNIN_71661 [Trichonephila inaurata madagascariensis]